MIDCAFLVAGLCLGFAIGILLAHYTSHKR